MPARDIEMRAPAPGEALHHAGLEADRVEEMGGLLGRQSKGEAVLPPEAEQNAHDGAADALVDLQEEQVGPGLAAACLGEHQGAGLAWSRGCHPSGVRAQDLARSDMASALDTWVSLCHPSGCAWALPGGVIGSWPRAWPRVASDQAVPGR